MQDLPLIATIAAGFTVAWLLGLLTQWLRLSPIVGYLIAGVLIGPNSPGFAANVDIANQLADIGIILLMFGVGLQFHIKDLLAVRQVAVPGTIIQIVLVTLMSAGVFRFFGIPFSEGVFMGMSMSVTSTVVLLRVLMAADAMNRPEGNVAFGWVILEDIFTVILLVLIPVLGKNPNPTADAVSVSLWWPIFLAVVKLSVLVVIVLWAGAKVVPRILVRVARLRSRELFTLTVLVFSVAVAVASYWLFGVSMAMGAFLAGMVVAQSPVSNQAAADALPMRDAFAVLFFVSVGMLFDPNSLIKDPLMILGALGVILLIKPLAALIVVRSRGYSLRSALTVALGLAQISEFSFILADLSWRSQLIPTEGRDVIVAAAILSITVNPLIVRLLPKVELWIEDHKTILEILCRLGQKLAASRETAALVADASPHLQTGNGPHAMVVGYGPVGRTVLRVMEEAGIQCTVVDLNMDTITALGMEGRAAIFGDASNERVLEQAGLSNVTHLVVTVPDAIQRAAIITAAKSVNEKIQLIVRARYLRERTDLERSGVSAAVFEEAEAAVALARLVLADTGVHRNAARAKLEEIRFQLAIETFPALRSLQVRAVMLPWEQVQSVSRGMSRKEILSLFSAQTYPIWPVLAMDRSKPEGYVVRQEFSTSPEDADWMTLIHPLDLVYPDQTVDQVFLHLREDNLPVCFVGIGDLMLGMVTRSHLLDRVEGDFATGKTASKSISLSACVARGGTICTLEATTRDEAILAMASIIPASALPGGTTAKEIVDRVFQREAEVSTDLGNGIALPHARCEGLAEPVVVIAHSHEGILYASDSHDPVRLLFLIVTPADKPETHLSLLSQIARLVGKPEKREALLAARSLVEFLEAIGDCST